MKDRELLGLQAREIAAAVRSQRLRAVEVLKSYRAQVDSVEGGIHAFLSLCWDRAEQRARQVDEVVRSGGDPGPLAGVPVAIKDNISTRGLRTTCASRVLEDFVPLFDATAVRKIEAAGAVIVGKTNLDEFGMGSSTENSAFGPTRNPWEAARVPGGSSGGSAAAVAAGMATLALGTDTGGSVRQPAGFCGLVGLKPQYGSVSRWGLVAFASSLDQIGPMARDAADCALLYNIIQGQDPRDATSLRDGANIASQDLDRSVRGLTLGLPSAWLGEGLDPEVRAALDESVRLFRDLGVGIEEVDLPDPRHAISVYYLLANAEASSNLARYDGVRYGRRSPSAVDLDSLYEISRGEGLGTEVKRRILLGTFVLSSGYYEAYYLKAQRVRELLRRRFEAAVARVDAILIPTSPTPAFRIGEKIEDPLAMYLSDVYTTLANLLGTPAVSFPAGLTREGLPIGLQLYGRVRDESTLLRLVRAHEKGRGADRVSIGAPWKRAT